MAELLNGFEKLFSASYLYHSSYSEETLEQNDTSGNRTLLDPCPRGEWFVPAVNRPSFGVKTTLEQVIGSSINALRFLLCMSAAGPAKTT
jgi:hypothetical protein